MWYSVYAANDGKPITDASFSENYWNMGGGDYEVDAIMNLWITVSAPNYQTVYVQNGGIVQLAYIGGWPQTY